MFIGTKVKFDYPDVFTTAPDYTAHAGQTVTVIRQLTEDECDPELTMFEIEAPDGWRGHAFASELKG